MANEADHVWIERFAPRGASEGPLVAVKDLIDVAGSITTAGSRAVADWAEPKERDAACVELVRRSGGVIAGKTNLHELAFGVSGVNRAFGTPANPSDPGRIPGGSSSGSAVAVAIGEADLALGSDTGGSIRIPAACCGVAGLKTTTGRVSTEGVFPLAPSYDTIGPLARDVAGLVAAMALLEGGFAVAFGAPLAVCRLRLGPEVAIDPEIERAVDRALEVADLEVSGARPTGWLTAWRSQQRILSQEAYRSDCHLLEAGRREKLGDDVAERLGNALQDDEELARLAPSCERFSAGLAELIAAKGPLVLATVPRRPAKIGEPMGGFNVLTAPVNLAGLPAVSIPVPAEGRPPTGLQLVGPAGGEELLLAIAGRIEQAVATTG